MNNTLKKKRKRKKKKQVGLEPVPILSQKDRDFGPKRQPPSGTRENTFKNFEISTDNRRTYRTFSKVSNILESSSKAFKPLEPSSAISDSTKKLSSASVSRLNPRRTSGSSPKSPITSNSRQTSRSRSKSHLSSRSRSKSHPSSRSRSKPHRSLRSRSKQYRPSSSSSNHRRFSRSSPDQTSRSSKSRMRTSRWRQRLHEKDKYSRRDSSRDRVGRKRLNSFKTREQRQTCYSDWYSFLSAPLQSNPSSRSSLNQSQVLDIPQLQSNPASRSSLNQSQVLDIPQLQSNPASRSSLNQNQVLDIPLLQSNSSSGSGLNQDIPPPINTANQSPINQPNYFFSFPVTNINSNLFIPSIPPPIPGVVSEPYPDWIPTPQNPFLPIFPDLVQPVASLSDMSYLEQEANPSNNPEIQETIKHSLDSGLGTEQSLHDLTASAIPINVHLPTPETTGNDTNIQNVDNRPKIRLNHNQKETQVPIDRDAVTPVLDEHDCNAIKISDDEDDEEPEPVKKTHKTQDIEDFVFNRSELFINNNVCPTACNDVKSVLDDLDYIPIYSHKLNISFTSESKAESIYRILSKIPSHIQMINENTNPCSTIITVEFEDIFYAFVANEILKHPDMEAKAEKVTWRQIAQRKWSVNRSGYYIWSLSLLTLDRYSTEDGLQRIPIKVCMNHKDEVADRSVLPIHFDKITLNKVGIEIEDYVSRLYGKIIIDNVHSKPVSVLDGLMKNFLRGKRKHVIVLKNWDEARVFNKLVQYCKEGQLKLEEYVSHIGVMENQELGVDLLGKMPEFLLDLADCLDEDYKDIIDNIWSPKHIFERNILYQFVLDQHLKDFPALEDFLKKNCLKFETRNLISILPVLPSHICFLHLKFTEVKGQYYIVAIDACLSNNFGTNHHLFLPVNIPDVDPSHVFGDKFSKKKQVCIHAERSFDLVSEKTALTILFSFIQDLSQNVCSLVLFNSYLSLPPLLSALERHQLVKSFYTTFTAVIQVVEMVKKRNLHCPSIEEVEGKDSNLYSIITICSARRKELSNFAKPISVVKYCTEEPEVFQVRTVMTSCNIDAYSQRTFACQINFSRTSPRSLPGFCLVPFFDSSSEISFQFQQHPVLLDNVTIFIKNNTNTAVKVNLKHGLFGILQLPPDRIGVPRSIPHLRGRDGIFSSTDGIIFGLEKRCDIQDELIPCRSREYARHPLSEEEGNENITIFENNTQEEVNRRYNQPQGSPLRTIPGHFNRYCSEGKDKRKKETSELLREKENKSLGKQTEQQIPSVAIEKIPSNVPQPISFSTQHQRPPNIPRRNLSTSSQNIPSNTQLLIPGFCEERNKNEYTRRDNAPVTRPRMENKSVFKFDESKFDDVILATFEDHGGWFMQVLFRSLVQGKPELRLGIRPNLVFCETCQYKTALHSTNQCPALQSCSCSYKPPHTRRSCKNPVCWICKENHPWRSCSQPVLDDMMKQKSTKGYRFLKDTVLFQTTDEAPVPCETKSKVLHVLGNHWNRSRNILIGRNIHTILKLFVSRETDNTHLIAGAVDLGWLLTVEQKNTDPATLLDIPKQNFHNLHLRSLGLEKLFSLKGVDISPLVVPINSIQDIDGIKTWSKTFKNTTVTSVLEKSCEINEKEQITHINFDDSLRVASRTSELHVHLNDAKQMEICDVPLNPPSPTYNIPSSCSEDEDIMILTTSEPVPSPGIILNSQTRKRKKSSEKKRGSSRGRAAFSENRNSSINSTEYGIEDNSEGGSSSNWFIPSKFLSLVLYPNFENFARGYFEMKNGDVCRERCNKIICHLASAMELVSIGPLLDLIKKNYKENLRLKDWVIVIQDEYQMFSDDFIPTELVVSILLWIFRSQSGGEKEYPGSKEKRLLIEADSLRAGSSSRLGLSSNTQSESREERARSKSKTKRGEGTGSRLVSRREQRTASRSESGRSRGNNSRSESGRTDSRSESWRSKGANPRSKSGLRAETELSFRRGTSPRLEPQKISGFKSKSGIYDCVIDEEIICLD